MATFNKFEVFSEDLAKGSHQLHAAGHTLKVALSNTAPTAATDAVFGDITEISAGNGYAAGGEDAQNTLSRSGGTTTIGGTDITWTASSGSIGPFRYAILYNDSQSSPVKPLIGYWDKGSEITVNDGDQFTLDLNTDDLVDIAFA